MENQICYIIIIVLIKTFYLSIWLSCVFMDNLNNIKCNVDMIFQPTHKYYKTFQWKNNNF